MARKKRRPTRSFREPAEPSGPDSGPPVSLPDRRGVEAIIRQHLDEVVGNKACSTVLDQAQEILLRAYVATDPEQRVTLAYQALEVSPDCADAYVLLAEHSRSRKQALELYAKGVAAGERALGPRVFQEQVGYFWELLETRPYLRARKGLACALWARGKHDEAIGHLQDMLRLNPSDNQGLRFHLTDWLLMESRDEELSRLLDRFEEATTASAYTRALIGFRRNGDTPETRKLLKAAVRANKHVPDYLIGRAPLPHAPPEYSGTGNREEAALYAILALAAWKESRGAIAWVRSTLQDPNPSRPPPRQAQGPTPLVKRQLLRVAQVADTWQAGFRRLPKWVEIAVEPMRPWVVLITNRSRDKVLNHDMMEEPPTAGLLWDQLARTMQRPSAGEPHRPTELQVRPDTRWDELVPHLQELGITFVPTETLDQIEFVFGEMSKKLEGEVPPGLLDVPGIDSERAAAFYHAAAGFHRRSPWRKLGDTRAVKVECDRFESGPWFAVIMGWTGVTYGIALYEDLKTLKLVWSGKMSEERIARTTVALAVTFENETRVPVADVDAAARHGWEVADPEAYPVIYRKELGLTTRPPLPWELGLMEGCLRAIPAFVARHDPDDPTPRRMRIPTASGELALVLSWVAGE